MNSIGLRERNGEVEIREATIADVPAMVECRSADVEAGPADARMAAYFEGRHHPQKARMERTGYVATVAGTVIGYCAGQLTTRFDCDGELQYLYVNPAWRRQRLAAALVRAMAGWFQTRGAVRVCVNADDPAVEFYRRMGAQPLMPGKPHWWVWENIHQSLS